MLAAHNVHGAARGGGMLLGMGATAAASPLVAIERAMVRLRRSITRRELGRRMLGPGQAEAPTDLSQLFAVDAVDDAAAQPGAQLTVGAVAERLGVDPSRASRLVASAVRAGYLRRVASQTDGRQSLLELTDAGRGIVEVMHAQRRAYFERLMRDWSERDRAEFARLLERFTCALGTLEATPPPSQPRARRRSGKKSAVVGGG